MLVFLLIVGLVCCLTGLHFPFNLFAGIALILMLRKALR